MQPEGSLWLTHGTRYGELVSCGPTGARVVPGKAGKAKDI